MTSPHITRHAIERAIERVPGITTEDQARAVLTSRAVLVAVEFGALFVRIGTGQHILIDAGSVVTVLPSNTHPNYLFHCGGRT